MPNYFYDCPRRRLAFNDTARRPVICGEQPGRSLRRVFSAEGRRGDNPALF